MRFRKISLLFCLSLAGCVLPVPHRQVIVPSISGLVTDAGTPVINTEVIFAHSSAQKSLCENPLASIRTDETGHVELNQQSEFKWIFVFGDPVSEWELCLKQQGKLLSLWKAEYIGVVPASLNFQCDISGEDVVSTRSRLSGHGLCKFSE